MTDHPAIAAGCTRAQINAFERIAVGMPTLASDRMLKALATKGLIEFSQRRVSDPLGQFTYHEPFVPFDVHAQWCAWCDENTDDEAVA